MRNQVARKRDLMWEVGQKQDLRSKPISAVNTGLSRPAHAAGQKARCGDHVGGIPRACSSVSSLESLALTGLVDIS